MSAHYYWRYQREGRLMHVQWSPICILTLLIYFNLSLNYYHYNYLEIDTLLDFVLPVDVQ